MLNPISFISKFIKSSNQRELDRISKIVKKVNSLENACDSLKHRGPDNSAIYKSPFATDNSLAT